MSINWDDLRLCLAVSREQSLSGAGKMLRLDPATLSRRVARLEKTLQVVLFIKSPQGYAPTEAGMQLLEQAKAAERAILLATEGIADESDQLRGQIRVGAPDGCANYVLPQVCARISAANPELDIQVVALPRLFNLSKREADMAIGVSAPKTGSLTVQKIAQYHLHLAASQAYLDQHDDIRGIKDLKAHPIVGYIPDMIFDKELDYLTDLGVSRVPLASNSVSVQVQMLRQGGGVGVVHDFSLPFAPELRRVLTRDFSLTRAFYLVRHSDDRRNMRLARFAEALAIGLRGELARLEAAAVHVQSAVPERRK